MRNRIAAVLFCLTCIFMLAGHAQFDVGDARAEDGDRFGTAVARGDFNGDGYQDLAVGLPDEDLVIGSRQIKDAGAVEVLYGTAAGLSVAGRQFWRQGAGLHDVPEQDDEFGRSLAAGDFNGDGYDDLAIGVPYEDIFSVADAGAMHVIYGSAAGLSVAGIAAQFWSDGSWYGTATPEPDARFGSSLTSADFNGDGYDDVAIGVEGENLSVCGFLGCYDEIVDAGAVWVLYGSIGRGLSGSRPQFWTQSSSGPDPAEERDYFGWFLAAGDFDGDGYGDLAVAAGGETVAAARFAGAVTVIRGSAVGLSKAVSAQFWHQDAGGIADVAENSDCFGCSLAAGDFNGDGYDDLAIGIPREDLHPIERGEDAGAVEILYGSAKGLTATLLPDQFWHQNTPDVLDRIESYDGFGASLTVGDFNRDGFDDLAIGIPGEDVDTLVVGTVLNAGAVSVLHGSSLGLSATAIPNQLWHQARTGVEDQPEDADHFGLSVAAGDFNGDGIDDLASGVNEDLPGISGPVVDAGAVSLIYGSMSGLNATIVPDQLWTQIVILAAQGDARPGDTRSFGRRTTFVTAVASENHSRVVLCPRSVSWKAGAVLSARGCQETSSGRQRSILPAPSLVFSGYASPTSKGRPSDERCQESVGVAP